MNILNSHHIFENLGKSSFHNYQYFFCLKHLEITLLQNYLQGNREKRNRSYVCNILKSLHFYIISSDINQITWDMNGNFTSFLKIKIDEPITWERDKILQIPIVQHIAIYNNEIEEIRRYYLEIDSDLCEYLKY